MSTFTIKSIVNVIKLNVVMLNVVAPIKGVGNSFNQLCLNFKFKLLMTSWAGISILG